MVGSKFRLFGQNPSLCFTSTGKSADIPRRLACRGLYCRPGQPLARRTLATEACNGRADDIDAFPATNIISSPRAHPSLDYMLGFLVRGGDAGAGNGIRLPGPMGIEVKDEFHRGKVEVLATEPQ